jgi:hypothetical protein
MPGKFPKFSMRQRLAAHDQPSETVKREVAGSSEPTLAIPGGPDGLRLHGVSPGHGKQRPAPLRLLQVQGKSGACYPLVLGDPEVRRARRS